MLDYDPASDLLSGRAAVFAQRDREPEELQPRPAPLPRGRAGHGERQAASFTREDEHELVISPRPKLKEGRTFVVTVRYEGVVEPVVDPDESIEGWIPTEDGAFVVNEPQGSPGWYPANDTPKDKATYDFVISVPKGREALANGKLVANFDRGEHSIWVWRARDPLAPYLSTATNGEFETRFGELPGGLPEYNAVDPQTRRYTPRRRRSGRRIRRLPGSASPRSPAPSRCSRSSTATTRSRRSERSSTGRRTSSTRSSRRRSRTTGRSPRSRRSSTRSPTSGSATP